MTRPGGLDVLWDDELRTEREPAKEPPRRWRNWWRADAAWRKRCVVCGHVEPVAAGRIYSAHCSTHPSKDIAETVAARLYTNPRYGRTYLGAFPDEEQPNNT